ncbi:hypothetical protein C3729_12985 [Cloacibacterium normanense]|uniref:Uncharacterized protein n=1 Tax=Cloacibacterium normanense TaxID=237258 RepID=A0A2S7I1S1_9FLAO|nr:hypothetical protein [Cloacibacterium normanense]PPZ90526.1 hypothetical protein C3729_12985 [Cloacibacterium normanense]
MDGSRKEITRGIHVIYSTIPEKNAKSFVASLEKEFYSDYKENIGYKGKALYSPLKYFMLGDFDYCQISLINNFKFTHRLFEICESSENIRNYGSHTLQSYTGFCLHDKVYSEKIFSEPIDEYFVGIIHLKLNNGIYIGTGSDFIDEIHQILSSILKDTKYLISQSFSWFELSLTVFIKSPKELANIIAKLRSLCLGDLINHKDIYENCLYKDFDFEENDIYKASLFADTNSTIGFKEDVIKCSSDSKIYKDFIDYIENYKCTLKTEIEWQVKPGHINQVVEELNNHNFLKDYFNILKRELVLGKCDYVIHLKSENSILANFHLLRDLYRSDNCQLYKHIRKVRTYSFLEPDLDIEIRNKSNILDWNIVLEKLCVSIKDFKKIEQALKGLKVSRQIRVKILKIISNYNNGILDPILFTYFLDFSIFIKLLRGFIMEEHSRQKKHITEVKEIEKKLNYYIEVFQESYNVRFLNGYLFENISDFDLDFNSSIQQLLTSYGSLVYEYGKKFYSGDLYYPLIRLNNIDTVSDYLSINYAVPHLTSPEFVVSTIIKEILNHIPLDSKELEIKLNHYNKELFNFKKYINESYFDDMYQSGMININYFIIDAIRFHITFKSNFKLFEYWFWTYNFQNTSLYDTNGLFNEQQLKQEIFRLLLIKKFFLNIPEIEVECPSPEIFTYWEKHFEKIKSIVERIHIFFTENNNFSIIDFIEQLKNNALENKNLPIDNIEKSLISYLQELKKKTESGKIMLLKRDWKTGEILKNYNSQYDDVFFAIDQIGGLYFQNTNKKDDYFSLNCKYLNLIIDFSAKTKKPFIKTLLKDDAYN